MDEEGRQFMRYTTVVNAFTHKNKGAPLWNNIVIPNSLIVLWRLSTIPVCSGVYGEEI